MLLRVGFLSILPKWHETGGNHVLDELKEKGIKALPIIDEILAGFNIRPISEDWPPELDIQFRHFHPDFSDHITITSTTVYVPWNIGIVTGHTNADTSYGHRRAPRDRKEIDLRFKDRLEDEAWRGTLFDPREHTTGPFINYSRGGWSTLIEATEFIVNHKRNGSPVNKDRLKKYTPATVDAFVDDVLGVSAKDKQYRGVRFEIIPTLAETSRLAWDGNQLIVELPGAYRAKSTLVAGEDDKLIPPNEDGEGPEFGVLTNCSPFCGGFYANADAHDII